MAINLWLFDFFLSFLEISTAELHPWFQTSSLILINIVQRRNLASLIWKLTCMCRVRKRLFISGSKVEDRRKENSCSTNSLEFSFYHLADSGVKFVVEDVLAFGHALGFPVQWETSRPFMILYTELLAHCHCSRCCWREAWESLARRD